MGEVLVYGPRLALGACDGDSFLGSIVEQVIASLESLVKDGIAPRGNDLDGGLESIKCELEADLVVALAGTAVRYGKAALLLSNGDLRASRHRTGERGTQEIDILINGVALDGWVAQLLNELSRKLSAGEPW